MSRLARQRRARAHSGGPARVVFGVLGGLFALGVIGIIVAVAYIASELDSIAPLSQRHENQAGANSIIFASNGTPLGVIQSDILRSPVPRLQLPTYLKDATVAIEDQRFYHHNGIDLQAILRAGIKNVTSGSTVQGGSTITMQLMRNLYLGPDTRSLKQKLAEAKLAMEYEKTHSKDYILSKYLNSVPYGTVGGQTAIGAGAASIVFFDKPVQRLTLPEAALLAGLPQAPSLYNPYLSRLAATQRRDEVLLKMEQLRYITPAQYQQAITTPIVLHHTTYYSQHRESFFFDYVKQQLIDRYGLQTVENGGLRVYTTIDLQMQEEARSAIANTLNQPGDPSSAAVTINPANGYIQAMAESQSYDKSQFNLASQGHRQAGSTFKAIVLMDALEHGADPNSTYYTSQQLLPGWLPAYPTYGVQTFEHTYGGSMNLVTATLKSDNTVYAQLDADLGPATVRATAYQLGVTTPLDALPSEGLGGTRLGVSPLEMANVFATLADGGWRNTPIAITRVRFPDGHADSSWGRPRRVKVVPDGLTSVETKILEENVQMGTGVNAQISCPAAGKTGTVDNFTDAWFDGYTPRYSTVVWVGYPNAKVPMLDVHGQSVQGGFLPALIWHAYMSQVVGNNCVDFPAPTQPASLHPFVGKYATSGVSGQFVGQQGCGGGNGLQTPGAVGNCGGGGGAAAAPAPPSHSGGGASGSGGSGAPSGSGGGRTGPVISVGGGGGKPGSGPGAGAGAGGGAGAPAAPGAAAAPGH